MDVKYSNIMTRYVNVYKLTKLIKQGKATLPIEFKALADWIDRTYNVKTINIIRDTIDNGEKKRLQIIFEFEKEVFIFLRKDTLFINQHKQKAIAKQYSALVDKSVTDILVVFEAFKPIAKAEANGKISKNKITNLKLILNDDIWEIARFAQYTTFFFYSKKQLLSSLGNGRREEIKDKYLEILKEYDEFGYFQDEFLPYFDSKENFDENYQSNWYYYYK